MSDQTALPITASVEINRELKVLENRINALQAEISTINEILEIEEENPRSEPEKLSGATTARGFRIIKFVDIYGEGCSLQKSSLATEDAVWVGVDNPSAKILTEDGWEPIPVPSDAVFTARMHLDRDLARELGSKLLEFAETGELPSSL